MVRQLSHDRSAPPAGGAGGAEGAPGTQSGRGAAERHGNQKDFWDARYTKDSEFFGATESSFARWCLPRLRKGKGKRLLELGFGYGRDARFFASQGFQVRGVDVSSKGAELARKETLRHRVDLVQGEVMVFLRTLPKSGADAVFSNLFYNMDFTEEEHQELFREVARVVRPGGLHLYSVRSTTDPWYGRGRRVRADTFDPSPDGITMHFFSPGYVRQISKGLFQPVTLEEVVEGEAEFPIRVLYVAERREGSPG